MTLDLDQIRQETIAEPYAIVNNVQYGFGTPTNEHLGLINERAPVALSRDDIFILPCFPSTNRIDSHLTRMDTTTLGNYMADAIAGTSVMVQHRTPRRSLFGMYEGELPIGRSFHAERQDEGTDQDRVLSWAYLLRNHFPNGREKAGTDDLIRAVSGGLISDVSVGFYLGRDGSLNCGICDRDHTNPWAEDSCDHCPGVEYDGKLAFDWVRNAHMAEYSLVYKGSTPGAIVARAQDLLKRQRISPAQARQFEDRTGVRMFTRAAGATLDTPRTDLLAELRAGREELRALHALVQPPTDERGAVKPHETPKAPPDTPWDGPAQRAKARPEDLRTMAAWIGPDPTAKSDYKFLHHEADGQHRVVKRGVDNAMARINQSNSVPASDRAAVEQHLRHHQQQFRQGDGRAAEEDMELASFIRQAGFEDAETWDDVAAQVRALRDERDAANARALSNEDRAKLGDEYVADLIEETLDWGVRAFDQDFDREGSEQTLRAIGNRPDLVKRQRDFYKQRAEAAFGAEHSLRQSRPEGDPRGGEPAKTDFRVTPHTPAEAYKTGRTPATRR